MSDSKLLYQTVVELCELVSAQQKELSYTVATYQAALAVLAENDGTFEHRFQAKYSLSKTNPSQMMQALQESCRRLDEAARVLKAEFGPWDN